MKAKPKKREARPGSPKVSPAPDALPPAQSKAKSVKSFGISPGVDPDLEVESVIPEELEPVWDASVAEAFQSLRPKQQDFILHYIQTGNAADSYRRAYNPNASDHFASSLGAQAMASNGIKTILSKFEEQKTHDLFLCVKTLREMAGANKPQWQQDRDGQWENAGDVPDWLARKHAVDGLTKLRGLNAADKVEHSGEIQSKIIRLAMPIKDTDVGIAPTGVPPASPG